MIVSNSHKFIFVHIHKTGGSSVSVALQPHLAWNDLSLGGSPLGEAMNSLYSQQFGLGKHSTLEEIKAVCGADLVEEYFSFAFVREPSVRAVSLYNYIAYFSQDLAQYYKKTEDELAAASISSDGSINHDFLNWSATRAFYLTNSFSDFIRSEEAINDMGFRPQIESLRTSDGSSMVKKIIKLEDAASELPNLWEALGFRFHLPHLNRPESYTQDPKEVSKSDRKYLRDLFADDYLALEY